MLTGLAPIPQQQVIGRYGWGKDLDILNLVELAKDSRSVQFRLISDPLHYEGLDYLDPILDGLNPPTTYNTASHVFKASYDFDVACRVYDSCQKKQLWKCCTIHQI